MSCLDCQHSTEVHRVVLDDGMKPKLGTIANLACTMCACTKKVELKEWTGDQPRSGRKGRGSGKNKKAS